MQSDKSVASTFMNLITQKLSEIPTGAEVVQLSVDRHKLARRRWRGEAADGTDFGFDVTEALDHGDAFFSSDGKVYVIDQQPEACFEIHLSEPKQSAWMGWMIGNLHFKAAFTDDSILVQDDLAVEQMLEREHIHFHRVQRVFQPSKQGGHSHDHDHGHSHSHSHGHSHHH